MKDFIARVKRFIETHNPVIERDYDVTTKVYRGHKEVAPAFSRHRAGSFRVSLWQAIAFFGGIAIALCFAPKKKKGKAKKK